MVGLHENSLKVSDLLLDGVQPGSAARRRAVSTAYYALFQCLSAVCAQCLSRARTNSEEYRRAYRVLDHRQVRDSLNRGEKLFRDNLAETFAQLQDARHWADYNVSIHPDDAEAQSGKALALKDARAYVVKARRAIAFLDGLDPPSRQRLALMLVLRDRR